MGVYLLKKGQSGIVCAVNVYGSAGERLKSLGVISGVKITLLAYSFFGGSALILVGCNRVALRRSVAERIEVTPC